MVRWRKVKEGKDVDNYKKHKNGWWIILWNKVRLQLGFGKGQGTLEKQWLRNPDN